jgi:hypothetical protein
VTFHGKHEIVWVTSRLGLSGYYGVPIKMGYRKPGPEHLQLNEHWITEQRPGTSRTTLAGMVASHTAAFPRPRIQLMAAGFLSVQ